jgi:glycosyltransferase involved in cell wall biosynthesis
MIESMASGTPVIGMSLGSAPEVIAHGKTGFLCHTVEECVAAIAPATKLNRADCRAHIAANFSVQRMVAGYEAVYQQILEQRFSKNGQFAGAFHLNV